jgi:hypothetical protein
MGQCPARRVSGNMQALLKKATLEAALQQHLQSFTR